MPIACRLKLINHGLPMFTPRHADYQISNRVSFLFFPFSSRLWTFHIVCIGWWNTNGHTTRRTRCHTEENIHKMGQQTSEKGKTQRFFLAYIVFFFYAATARWFSRGGPRMSDQIGMTKLMYLEYFISNTFLAVEQKI